MLGEIYRVLEMARKNELNRLEFFSLFKTGHGVNLELRVEVYSLFKLGPD